MISPIEEAALRRFRSLLATLYGDRAELCTKRLAMLAGRYGIGLPTPADPRPWSERDAVLITYGDMVHSTDRKPLEVLRAFLKDRVGDAFSTVHILPFFPWSSDDGFSVIHFRQVDPALGDWSHIEAIAADYRLMADLVLNHVSRKSGWFHDYATGVAPGRDYFIAPDPSADLSGVVRPRTHPLLTPVRTRDGERHVWTTFSDDQIDLNYANPDVLFEVLDILLFYIERGARVIRLDAIAYLWKRAGTPCIHLPETHTVVKLIRGFLGMVAPDVTIITETNVPHAENVSYFGDGDEAHMVYQFPLPPLALHAIVRGHAQALTAWAATLAPPPPGCTFLNFTASHDGIGVRPLAGLVPDREVDALAHHITGRGGRVSMKRNTDGSESPYELNATYFDAVGGDSTDEQVARFLCTQTLPLAMQGVPAVYFHSLTATPNDLAGFARTGRARTLNRHKWHDRELESVLANPASATARVFPEYLRRLRIRASCAAFSPGSAQRIHSLDDRVFAVERIAPSARAFCLHNLSGGTVPLRAPVGYDATSNLLAPGTAADASTLAPYECRWLPSL